MPIMTRSLFSLAATAAVLAAAPAIAADADHPPFAGTPQTVSSILSAKQKQRYILFAFLT